MKANYSPIVVDVTVFSVSHIISVDELMLHSGTAANQSATFFGTLW